MKLWLYFIILTTSFYFQQVVTPASIHAQSLDLAVAGNGLSLGDSEYINGIRLNFRDRRMRQTNGINVTLWQPHSPARGKVNGMAVGLPLTGGDRIRGLGIGVGGVSADHSISGIAIGGLGMGAGEEVSGIGLAGLGAGTGGDMKGIFIAGLGAGAGNNVEGILLAGLGAGAGENIKGIAVGAIGVGAGNNFEGIGIGGIGAGAGNNATGFFFGGIGAGAGNDLTGIAIGGIGVGCGNKLSGVAAAVIAAGAPEVEGILLTGIAAGGVRVKGVSLTPGYFKIEDGGSLTGVSISSFNHVRGHQRGLTIGLFNYAESLHGVQLGLINFAGNNKKGLRWLPIFNAHFN